LRRQAAPRRDPASVRRERLEAGETQRSVAPSPNPLLRGKPIIVAAYSSRIACIVAPSIEAKTFGIKAGIGCRTFRATGITIHLANGGDLEKPQQMVAHETSRTTNLYDRTSDEITLDEVERISIYCQNERLAGKVGGKRYEGE
jgi:integrase